MKRSAESWAPALLMLRPGMNTGRLAAPTLNSEPLWRSPWWRHRRDYWWEEQSRSVSRPPSLHAHLQPWSKVWLFPQREQLLSGRIRADPARNCLRDSVWIFRSDWTMMMIKWTDVRRKASRDSLFYSSPSIQERCDIRSADEVLSRVRGQQTCKAIICWSG